MAVLYNCTCCVFLCLIHKGLALRDVSARFASARLAALLGRHHSQRPLPRPRPETPNACSFIRRARCPSTRHRDLQEKRKKPRTHRWTHQRPTRWQATRAAVPRVRTEEGLARRDKRGDLLAPCLARRSAQHLHALRAGFAQLAQGDDLSHLTGVSFRPCRSHGPFTSQEPCCSSGLL